MSHRGLLLRNRCVLEKGLLYLILLEEEQHTEKSELFVILFYFHDLKIYVIWQI